jgi:uncharacterized protein YjbJ (UPF0337 family)
MIRTIGGNTMQHDDGLWDQIEGNWKQLKGKVREKWGLLTDDDVDTIGGKKDRLVGKIQERYGEAKWKDNEIEREMRTMYTPTDPKTRR